MKKVLALILCAFILCGVLCSCGASSGPADYKAETDYAPGAVEAPMEPAYNDAYYEEDYGYDADAPVSTTASVVSALTRPNDDLGAKMIYRANAAVETVEFDKTIENVYSLIADFSGFIESSNVSGADYRTEYYGYQTYRDASFTIRVPKENYAGLTESLASLGNLTHLSATAENITQKFTDAQARLEAYEAEEDRLISMMEKAVTVEDLITIEARLSEVRYNIESITSTLRNWQNEVDYSTVDLYLKEVAEITPVVPVNRTFGQEIRDGFAASLKSVGRFFTNLAKWFIINLPVIVTIVVIIGIILLIIIKTSGRRERRSAKRAQKRAERRAKLRADSENLDTGYTLPEQNNDKK